jgi:type VI secretion system protein VasD
MRRQLGRILAFALALAGCTPPPPPPTIVNLVLAASADVNPTASGVAAPLELRVYQLASESGFSNAGFFQLFNQDRATLGADLIKSDSFILAPGQTKTATLTPTDAVKSIGVFAAYRNYQQATWRGSVAATAHKTTGIDVVAGRDAVVIASKPEPAGK